MSRPRWGPLRILQENDLPAWTEHEARVAVSDERRSTILRQEQDALQRSGAAEIAPPADDPAAREPAPDAAASEPNLLARLLARFFS